MKQNIKNTLYRFITMRNPELIEDGKKDLGFVKFPEGQTSVFIPKTAPVESKSISKLSVEATVVTPETYKPAYETTKDLKNANVYFYNFAKWVTANRTKLTVAETAAQIEAFANIKIAYPNMIKIWDDLHHNILNSGDSYTRDLLLSFLVADFFKNNISKVAQTDEAYQKLAQARVIIDKRIFNTPAKTKLAKKQLPIAEKHFKKEMDAVIAKQNVEELERINKEVAKAKVAYDKENQKAKDAYQKSYDNAVKEAYAAATLVERIITDKDTGKSEVVTEYQNLNIPEYNFVPADELDTTKLTKQLSSEALNYVNELQSANDYSTLDEMTDAISSEVQNNTSTVFENVDFGVSEIVIPGGGSIPVSPFPTTPFSFSCCSRKKIGSSLYNIVMTLNMPNPSFDVVSVVYHVKYADGTSNTSGYFDENKIGNKIMLKFYNGGVDLNKPTSEFFGTITFSNGQKYTFGITNFVKAKCFLGSLIPDDSTNPTDTEAPLAYGLQRLGIADYRKVEQEVCCYVPGEVSHIENIMAREHKLKNVTRTRRQETTDTFSSETERENLTETTSTDRFEMNQEMSSLSAKDKSISASAGLHWGSPSGSFGGQANASFATNTSTEESNSQAVTHAKELTERALDRVVQKIREERVSKVIEEYEENSSHGFDNRKGDKHISGVYRWVDKVYRNKVLNYGKRLMYEFMIPEPATFHDLAIQLKGDNNDEVLVKPVDPRTASVMKMKDHKSINSSNYAHWASIYNAEINAMPDEYVYTTGAFSDSGASGNYITGHNYSGGKDFSMDVPDNYKAISYSGSFGYSFVYKRIESNTKAALSIGNNIHKTEGRAFDNKVIYGYLGGSKKTVGVGFHGGDVGGMSASIELKCKLLDEAKEAWKLETFNAIISAYEERLAIYNEKLAEQQTKQNETLNVNPGFYRQIEKTVLRKNCIAYLLGQENLGKDMIDNRTSLTGIVPKYKDAALDDYAARVKFFEQAFEWDIMSYHFYPFYWANSQKWGDLYQIQNNDPLFKAFLQSGMARVIITVRPGFEEMVNWYLATGQIWNGGQVPTIDDPEFVSIVEELRNPESEVEETWETRVPTSLTVIQAGAIGLDVEGLPCDTDCDDWKQFDSDGNPVLDANGNPVTNNPIVKNDELIGGEGNDASASKKVQFSFFDISGSNMENIGRYDAESAFPVTFKCQDQEITIQREAQWNTNTNSGVIYQKLADQISLIDGLEAQQVYNNAGDSTGLKFVVDTAKVSDFSLEKMYGKAHREAEYDDVRISFTDTAVKVVSPSGGYLDRILDKNNQSLTNAELNTNLPINRFQL